MPVNIESGDPHAMTVSYDVEALWVIDDIDSVWREQADHARQAYPEYGDHPGVDDDFQHNDGHDGFFAFHDYNPDYFVVTGENFPGHVGSIASIRQGHNDSQRL